MLLAALSLRKLGAPRPLYLDSEVEVLARVIHSEIGTGTRKQKIHVAWVARNLAAESDQSLAAMVCSPCGPQERGRPLSTLQEPTDSERELARKVLRAKSRRDPTGGATHFINPRLQNKLAKSGRLAGYKGNTYQKVSRRWKRSYGWEPYYRLGPELEMWGKRRPKASRRRRHKR